MNAKMDVTYVVAIPDAPTHWEVTNVYVRVITPRLEINVSVSHRKYHLYYAIDPTRGLWLYT